MRSLTLLRHAQTGANTRDLLCGRANVALTEVGRRQADQLGKQLGAKPWARIVSSPLDRARRTAQAVCDSASTPLYLEPRLMEIDYGQWEGRSIAELWRVDLHFQRFRSAPVDTAPPGGESLRNVATRALSVVQELEHAHALGHLGEGPILLVSHKTTVRALACVLTGAPLETYRDLTWEPGTWVEFAREGSGWTKATRGP